MYCITVYSEEKKSFSGLQGLYMMSSHSDDTLLVHMQLDPYPAGLKRLLAP